MVLRIGPASGHLHPGAEHVPERRLARHRRRVDRQLRRARHLAGDAAQQVRGHLSAQLQVEEARDLPRRAGRAADLPGADGRLSRAVAVLHRAGQVDVAAHEPAAARSRLFGRHPALLRHLPARHGQQRGTRRVVRATRRVSTRWPAACTTAPRSDRSSSGTRPIRHSATGADLVRDRHAQHQDRHAVRRGATTRRPST